MNSLRKREPHLCRSVPTHLCRTVRSDAMLGDVRLVVVTAEAFPPQIDRARAAGAHAVLVKPCSPDALLATLEELVSRSRQLTCSVLSAASTSVSANSGTTFGAPPGAENSSTAFEPASSVESDSGASIRVEPAG